MKKLLEYQLNQNVKSKKIENNSHIDQIIKGGKNLIFIFLLLQNVFRNLPGRLQQHQRNSRNQN